MQTIAETNSFQKRVKSLGISSDEVTDMISSIAKSPDSGTPLGAGLYKIRIARKDTGKSGGYRVLYFYKPIDMPIFLITIFAKNEKDNITNSEKNKLVELCNTLSASYEKKS